MRRGFVLGMLLAIGALAGGINTDGLAVVDTQVATTSHGVGWLRSFLTTHLLRECTTVAEAVALANAPSSCVRRLIRAPLTITGGTGERRKR